MRESHTRIMVGICSLWSPCNTQRDRIIINFHNGQGTPLFSPNSKRGDEFGSGKLRPTPKALSNPSRAYIRGANTHDQPRVECTHGPNSPANAFLSRPLGEPLCIEPLVYTSVSDRKQKQGRKLRKCNSFSLRHAQAKEHLEAVDIKKFIRLYKISPI